MGALYDPALSWFDEAEKAIQKALALDPGNPAAWTARGRMFWSSHGGFKNEIALRDLTRACAHPAHPHDAPLWRSVVLTHVGLHDEALTVVDEALEIQPDDPMALIVKGETLGWMGDSGSFCEYMERILTLDPASSFGHLLYPIPLVYLDRLEESEIAVRKARGIMGEDSLLMAVEALVWAKRGEPANTLSKIDAALRQKKSVSHTHHTYHYVAAAYATLGEPSLAIETLALAADAGMPNYPAFIVDPHFELLREEAAFQSLMTRVKAGYEALRAEFGAK